MTRLVGSGSASDILTTINLTSFTPQGRLTLSSSLPVMIADTVNVGTVYYLPSAGYLCPIYNGTIFELKSIGSSGLSCALDSASGHTNYHQSGQLYDWFVINDAGTMRIGTGPKWSSSSSRGTGAGTTQISMLNGLWVNTVSITIRFGSASGNTVVVAANQATYVGTMYCTADGQTGVAYKPAAASGGSNNIVGLWNAYNQNLSDYKERDSTVSWTNSSSAAFVTANSAAGTGNRISFVDGLGTSQIRATCYSTISVGTSVSNQGQVGILLNATSGAPATRFQVISNAANGPSITIVGADVFPATMGFNFIQQVEISNNGTTTFNANGNLQALLLQSYAA